MTKRNELSTRADRDDEIEPTGHDELTGKRGIARVAKIHGEERINIAIGDDISRVTVETRGGESFVDRQDALSQPGESIGIANVDRRHIDVPVAPVLGRGDT